MLLNARYVTFTVSELLRENQQEGGREFPPTNTPRLGLKKRHKAKLISNALLKISQISQGNTCVEISF